MVSGFLLNFLLFSQFPQFLALLLVTTQISLGNPGRMLPSISDCSFMKQFLQHDEFRILHKELIVFLPKIEICLQNKFIRRIFTSKESTTPFIAFHKCSERSTLFEPLGYAVLLFLCDTATTVATLQNVNKEGSTLSKNYLAIFIYVSNGHNLIEQLGELQNITNFILFEDTPQQEFNVFQVSRVLQRGRWIKTGITNLNLREDKGKKTTGVQFFSERSLSNFEGQSVRVAAVMSSAFAFDTNILENGNGSYEFLPSFAIEILKGFECVLNFTALPVVTRTWGHLEHSKWKGMIGLLVKNEADIGISSTADRPFRRQVVDFNHPTTQVRLIAFFRRPPSYVLANPLTRPFNIDLWVAIVATTSLIGLSLCLANQLLPKGSGTIVEVRRWNSAECFQWTLSTMCFKGHQAVPTETTIRIILSTALFFSVIASAAYGGTLLSFLLVQVEPINTLDELLATDFKFEIIDDPIAIKTLQESKHPEEREIYERSRGERKSMTESVKDLNGGSFVFVVDHMNGYRSLEEDFTHADSCEMREFTIGQSEQKEGSMVRKGSSLRRILDFQILRMSEFGLIKRWERIYLNQKPSCELIPRIEGIRMDSIQTALGAFAGALVASFIILAVEVRKRRLELLPFLF